MFKEWKILIEIDFAHFNFRCTLSNSHHQMLNHLALSTNIPVKTRKGYIYYYSRRQNLLLHFKVRENIHLGNTSESSLGSLIGVMSFNCCADAAENSDVNLLNDFEERNSRQCWGLYLRVFKIYVHRLCPITTKLSRDLWRILL